MVREVVRDFIESHPTLKVTLDICIEHTMPLPDVRNNAVYYVLREALNNVIRHAKAEHVSVQLTYKTEKLTLEISDDGIGGQAIVGLPVNELLRKQHFGMADMYWWASLGEGQLEVVEGERGGTVVRLTLPVF
jgi:signal transduction histidine kinase